MQYISLQQCADKILRMTRRMLEYAEAGEWTLMGQLEQERGKSMQHLFRHPQIQDSLQTISDTLFEVMQLDRSCIELTEQARQAMLESLNQQTQGSKALKVYTQHSG